MGVSRVSDVLLVFLLSLLHLRVALSDQLFIRLKHLGCPRLFFTDFSLYLILLEPFLLNLP